MGRPLIFEGVKAFTFDSANRLTGAGSSTLAYDPLDRMTQMVGTLGARYLYDGDEIACVVVASTGTTIANRIVRGPWPDELLAAYQGNTASTPLWSLQDHQSSIIAITDAAGTAPYTLGYDEHGQPRAGNAGRLMYTGQLWMPDFGLYHYKARAYHPGLGRFVQTDPVGYEQGMNLYAYVGLDPMNATDPDGQVRWLIRTLKGGLREVRRVQAERALRRGRDVYVEGGGSSKRARSLANDVFGSDTRRHDPHAPGQHPHYQHRTGGRGHVNYTAPGAAVAAAGTAERLIGGAADTADQVARDTQTIEATRVIGDNLVTRAFDDWLNPSTAAKEGAETAAILAEILEQALREARVAAERAERR